MNKLSKLVVFFIFFGLFLQFFNINIVNFSKAESINKNFESMVTIEASTGRILYSQDEHKRLPMASTTKILTAIVAIENCDDLDKKYEISKSATGIEGSSIYLKAGEHLSVRELLYGLMLRSGNDSAVAIAEIISGSVEKFVLLMNECCKKLNLKDTSIVTVNGLHNENHYSSAYDLAIISAYAMKNEVFAEIVKTKQKNIDNEFSKFSDHIRVLVNKNRFLDMVNGADGVKIGYTKKAGKCFVGSATRSGMQVIFVCLNAKTMFDDACKYIEKAFKEYSFVKLLNAGKLSKTSIKNGKSEEVPVILKNDIWYPLTDAELQKTKGKLAINENLSAPIKNNTEIGTIELWLENNLIFSQKVYTIDVEKKEGISDFIKKIIKSY